MGTGKGVHVSRDSHRVKGRECGVLEWGKVYRLMNLAQLKCVACPQHHVHSGSSTIPLLEELRRLDMKLVF